VRGDKRTSLKSEGKGTVRGHKRGVVGYSRKTALLEEAITQMNAGKYGRSSSALKELLALDPQNMEARRLFATLHLRLGSLIPARQAFDMLITEAFQRQDYWLAESLLREYLAAGPRCVPFLEKLGVIYQEKGDVQEAVAEYGKAIDILIEDPDPDNPHLVSQLYQKVRELAPASPIAIRLASFFDAQTGELIARAPTPTEPAAEPLAATTDHQAVPEPASGAMPWDIDTSQSNRPASGETISQPDGLSSFASSQDREVLPEAVTANGQSELSSDVPIPAQSDCSLGESTPAQSPELTHHEKAPGARSAHEENRVPPHGNSPGAQAGVPSSDLPVEARAGVHEPGATGAEDRQPAALGMVEPTQQSAETELVCPGESSVVQQPTTDQPSAANGLTALTHGIESAAVLQRQVASSPLPEVVSPVPDSAAGSHTETLRDLSASGGSGHGSSQSSTEPWKEPGFSWKTLFDRAWNFGTPPAAGSTPQEATPLKSETPPIFVDRSPEQRSSIESESAQIPERVENAALMEEATSTGSVRPLPWDQIQESAVPIPPAEVEEAHREGIATAEGQASPIGEDKSSFESAAVEIPARTDRDAVAVGLTETGSVRPLPWDQIQESALPIPPAPVEESHGEGTAVTQGHSYPIGEDKPSLESAAVEIPARTDRDAVAVELTETGSVRPLPWDQIQESALPIPSAQVEAFHGEGTMITEGQSVATVQDKPQAEHEAVEIAESVGRDAAIVELTTTAFVSPLPWDQIQESTIPPPPAEVEESDGKSVAITAGLSDPIGEDKPSLESAIAEIPARTDRDAVAVELTETGSVRPLPWDQIQESALPIPPAEVEEFHGGGAATTESPSGSLGEDRASIASVAVELPEKSGQEPVEELTATGPVTLLPQDPIQESVLPLPTALVEEFQAGGMATSEERATSPVGEGEVEDVDQPHSLTSAALAPASEETESPSKGTSSGLSLLSESDVSSAQVHDAGPEAPRPEIGPAVPLTASRSDDAPLRSSDAGSTLPPAVAQTDDLDQNVPLRLHHAQDGERESAAPQSLNTQEREAEPIRESEQPQEFLLSSTDGSVPVDTLLAAPLPPIEKGSEERGEGTVAHQDVATEEAVAASSLLRDSPPAVPPWRAQEQESVTAYPVEREVITTTPVETFSSSSRSELTATVQNHGGLQQDDLTVAESTRKSAESAGQPEDWAKTSESIRFVEEPPRMSAVTVESEQASVAPAIGMVADDTRFMSSRNVARDASSEQEVESPSRPKVRSERRGIGVTIQDFIGSCFSTTRAIVATCVGLVLLSVIAVAAGIGMVGLTWLSLEEGPSPAYQSFTTIPQQTLSDFKKNGYFLLVGFDSSAQLDPIQAGYEGKMGTDQVATGQVCLGDTQGPSGQQSNASASVSKSWFRSADPVGQFKSHSDSVRGWASQQASALSRYGRWHTLSFEDWGYGQTSSLPCASIAFAHELYLADGFLQAMEEGVERLETDMEAWRIVLGQARTLPVKALALQAMNDDIAVASGLLIRSDFDSKYLGRFSKMLRPLDQAELSIRWPMQSELVVASKTYEGQLRAAKAGDQSVYATITSMLSLPKQRRLNDYAEYYEASYKAVGEGHHSTLPKWKDYIRTPAAGLSDYLANPIENIVGLEVLPPWDLYHGQVMDTEARLRLASLQAWLRRGPTDGDLLTRLAKAGQKFYDPYTGLPMLVNMKKSALYSVGHDGKDQDADPQFDVVVTLPAVPTSSSHASSKSSTESSKP